MKFFIDSANMDEIRKAKAWGMLDGVTTNPSLIAKEGRDYYEAVREVALEVDGPVSGEVLATDYDGMMREGHELAKIAPNVVVKIPMLPEGMRAVRTLTSEGIRTNVTLVFSASQALVAAKAGASYVSPFVGRLDDISHVGMDVVAEIVQIYENFDYATEVLVASARHPLHVIEAAKLGADVTTMPFKVMEQLFKHPLTDIGLARFLADWEQAKRELAAAAATAGRGR